MKNFKALILLSSIILITSCTQSTNSSNSLTSSSENSTISSVIPESSFSLSNSPVSSSSEKIESSSVASTSEVKYATWPTQSIQNLCLRLSDKCTETIPSYDYATGIEIDTEHLLDDAYFGVYCYVDSAQSETIYINKLKENKWKVSETKIEGFYEAYSPEGFIWLNFAYDSSYQDLEIYVSEAPITSWPEELINKNLQYLSEGTKTTIPSFEASLYTVNYYVTYSTLAINGYGVDANILETYKTKVSNLGWSVDASSENGEYLAVSPAKDLNITFYYDESRDEFNIDVQRKKEENSSWPKDAISGLVASMGLTGEVMEYTGEYTNVELDNSYYPPAVMVYVASGTQRASAAAYNDMLLNNGYVLAGKMYGEEIYNLPGTTLAYHATYLNGNCFTIELFSVTELQ